VTDDAKGVTLCDTTIELTGTPYVGTCPSCDFSYSLDSEVAKEAGADCDYEVNAVIGSFLETSLIPDRWIGFSSVYGGWRTTFCGRDRLRRLRPGSVLDHAPRRRRVGRLGRLREGRSRLDRGLRPPVPAWAVSYCGTSAGYAGTSYYPGAYAEGDSIPCSLGDYYDRWSFYASSDDYVSISVDTVSSSTTFDPLIVVTDSATCELAFVGTASIAARSRSSASRAVLRIDCGPTKASSTP
jgi:hypothetical protein